MQHVINALRHAYTIRAMRHALQRAGLNGDHDVSSDMFRGAPEHVAAAALARATVGA